jgi:DNA-binding NarL/FixJ family response regulator
LLVVVHTESTECNSVLIEGETKNFRVLLADDHDCILAKIREVLFPCFEVVGAVGNGESLVKACNSLDPDVLVLDISMPVLNGLQAVEQLKHDGCRAKIVFLTIFEEQSYVDACFSAGADAYVFKSRIFTDLIESINEVLAGRKYLSDHPIRS